MGLEPSLIDPERIEQEQSVMARYFAGSARCFMRNRRGRDLQYARNPSRPAWNA